MNAGNAYAFAGNSPWNFEDPIGLTTLMDMLDPDSDIPSSYGGYIAVAASSSELGAELANVAMMVYCMATSLDGLQMGLDALGFIEPFGAIADGINGGIYLVRGQWGNAAISIASIFAADALVKPLRYADEVLGVVRGADNGLGAGARGADNGPGGGVGRSGNGGHARDTNPSGGTNNCAHCSINADRRLAGGAPASPVNRGPERVSHVENTMGSTFRGAGIGPGAQAAIEQTMTASGLGSRGIVYANNGPGTMGHFFNVANQRSGVNFFDDQIGAGGARHFQNFTHFWLMITN